MSMDRKTEFVTRVYVVFLAFLILGVVLLGKVFYIGVVEGQTWRSLGDSLYVTYQKVEADRGNILADDGSLLATSLPFFEIRMDTRATGLVREVNGKKVDFFKREVGDLAKVLSETILKDRSPEQIKSWLIRERQNQNRYLLIARDVNYPDMQLIKTFPLFKYGQNKGGLITIRKHRRELPFKHLAKRTIGLYREESVSVGIENAYNKYLKGEEGQRLMKRVGPEIYIPLEDVTEFEPKRGSDVQTTINIQIQDIAEHALEEAIIKHNAQAGCVIVMETQTGAIKAIANLGRDEAGNISENYNYAVGYSSEPGSTFKLASSIILLEEGKANLKTPVLLNGGITSFFGHDMKDSEKHGITMSDLLHSFAISSNVGISKLVYQGFHNDKQTFANYFKKFRLDRPTGIDLEGEPKPMIKDVKQWSGTSLPWMSIGYEVQLTPLQMLNFYNTVATGGKIMKPYIVSQIKNENQEIKQFGPKVLADSVISPDALAQAYAMLKSVIETGTAKTLKSEHYTIGGKTGTAKVDYASGIDKYQASFAGFFPLENPIYTVMAVIYNPTEAGVYGAQAAGPIVKKIADHCMQAYQFEHSAVLAANSETNAHFELPVHNHGYSKDFENIFDFIGLPFHAASNAEWIRTLNEQKGINAIQVKQIAGTVPEVIGMGLRDAMFQCDKAGVRVITHGTGKVRSQSIEPGTKSNKQLLELYLE